MKKKFLSLLTACLLMSSFCVTSVSAAEPVAAVQEVEVTDTSAYATVSDYYRGSTGTMNSMAGAQSRVFSITSRVLPSNAVVTLADLNVRVSSGSVPFYLVVAAPSGNQYQMYVDSSTSLTTDSFEGEPAKGTWQLLIYNTGSSFTDVSTATVSMTVYYQY